MTSLLGRPPIPSEADRLFRATNAAATPRHRFQLASRPRAINSARDPQCPVRPAFMAWTSRIAALVRARSARSRFRHAECPLEEPQSAANDTHRIHGMVITDEPESPLGIDPFSQGEPRHPLSKMSRSSFNWRGAPLSSPTS